MEKLLSALVITLAVLAGGCREGSSEPDLFDQSLEAQAASKLLEPAGWVTDQADLLDPQVERDIAARLQSLENSTGHQIAVVTVTSVERADIAQFTDDLGNRWGVGRKEFDDGVVILVASNERQVRISVGDGLRSALTDEFCQDVIETRMTPHFSRGDFVQGITSGTEAVIARLD